MTDIVVLCAVISVSAFLLNENATKKMVVFCLFVVCFSLQHLVPKTIKTLKHF